MSSLISLILRVLFKEYYRGAFALGLELANVIITLCIYYFPSQALTFRFQEYENFECFNFILLADIAFLIPFFLMEGHLRVLKSPW